jgi:hypothetical protein
LGEEESPSPMTSADFPIGCRIALTEKAIATMWPFERLWPQFRLARGMVTAYGKFMDIDTIYINWDRDLPTTPPSMLHPSHLQSVPSGLENVSVRHRNRRGGRVQEGLDFEWKEWQVVSGRRVISRHDSQELAWKAAHERLLKLESSHK